MSRENSSLLKRRQVLCDAFFLSAGKRLELKEIENALHAIELREYKKSLIKKKGLAIENAVDEAWERNR